MDREGVQGDQLYSGKLLAAAVKATREQKVMVFSSVVTNELVLSELHTYACADGFS